MIVIPEVKALQERGYLKEVGKQTRSDPMETVRPGTSPSDSPEVSWRETKKISLSHVAKQACYA